MEPRRRFNGINSASLCCLAGRYDKPIPTRFLALIDCSKIPALLSQIQYGKREGMERGGGARGMLPLAGMESENATPSVFDILALYKISLPETMERNKPHSLNG
jgi:hypothetical protein